jgi:3-carboxy-cis,cis-muconate cycloisomerase
MGIHEDSVRTIMAKKLGLHAEIVPWHASRDRLIEVTSQCANLCVTLVRLAREIIDLSRSEINEVYEPGGLHKGASSTMPQKRNPVLSEAIIGVGIPHSAVE